MVKKHDAKTNALLAAATLLVVCGLGGACRDASDAEGPNVSVAELAPLEYPPRDSRFDDGAPDSCVLLRAADPAQLYGEPMGPAQRMLSLCIADLSGWDGSGPERSVQLEIRKADERGVPADLEAFWVAEGAGIEFVGGKREAIQRLPDLADLALYVPITNGVRFYSYWDDEYILLLTVLGAPDPQAALAWSQELIGSSIEASRQATSARRVRDHS